MPTHLNRNGSMLSMQVKPVNFTPQLSASLAVSGANASITFTPLTGTLSQTFQITNKGTHGAYIAWGKTTATAVASSSVPAANCHYIGAGCILVNDFVLQAGGIVDTIAAVQDGGSTTLEISVGVGQ